MDTGIELPPLEALVAEILALSRYIFTWMIVDSC
jgi:hypothetical protein